MSTRQAIYDEVLAIDPLDALEAHTRREVLAWIDSGVELCRTQKPATPPRHLVSYVVLVDGDYVLLVDHIKAGLWLPPGGHVERGEHPRATAAREAMEELGLEAIVVHDAPHFLTSTTTVGSTAGHVDVSLWYLLTGDRHATLAHDGSEFHDATWFHHDMIPYPRTDPQMHRFIKKLYGEPQ